MKELGQRMPPCMGARQLTWVTFILCVDRGVGGNAHQFRGWRRGRRKGWCMRSELGRGR